MNRKEILKRINELKSINKVFELITDDIDEQKYLEEIEGTIDEAIYFYQEKLEEINMVSINQGQAYSDGIRENIHPAYVYGRV